MDPAVHPEEAVQAPSVDGFADQGDPLLRALEEGLPSASRLHRHHQRDVAPRARLEEPRKRGPGLDREPGAQAARPDLAQRADRIRDRLEVHDEVIGPGFGERLHVSERLDDHEVHIQRQRGESAHGADQDGTEREIGHELPVHHVHVQEVGSRAGDARDLVAEAGEISGEDRGANPVLPRARPAAGRRLDRGRRGHGCS